MPAPITQTARTEGLTPQASLALGMFERSTRQAYGRDLLKIVLFGSRARGDAGPESDVDVAVVLDRIADRRTDRDRLADLAYEAVIETYVELQALPVSRDEWERPELHPNPDLVRAIKRDGVAVENGNRHIPDELEPALNGAAAAENVREEDRGARRMRLTKFQRTEIVSLAHLHFGPHAVVRLFGSRTRDEAIGGDIDLHIQTDRADVATLAKELEFIADLKDRIADEKIDVIVRGPHHAQRGIDDVAINSGTVLI